MAKKWFEKDATQVIKKATTKFLEAAGVMVNREAVRRVPVDTGRLKGSLAYKVKHPICEVGTNVEYATHVEYGTKFMGAQPYLRPALDKNRKKLSKLYSVMVMKEFAR